MMQIHCYKHHFGLVNFTASYPMADGSVGIIRETYIQCRNCGHQMTGAELASFDLKSLMTAASASDDRA